MEFVVVKFVEDVVLLVGLAGDDDVDDEDAVPDVDIFGIVPVNVGPNTGGVGITPDFKVLV